MERVSKTLVAALVAGVAGQAGASTFEFVLDESFSINEAYQTDGAFWNGAVTSASFGQGVAVIGTWGETKWFDVQAGEYKTLIADQGEDFDHMTALSGGNLLLSGGGSAQLFDMATGNHVRDLLPVTGEATGGEFGFGRASAVQGNTAIVTDRVANKAYVFDVTTGQELRTLVPTAKNGGILGDIGFGQSVAISGNMVVVTSDMGGGRSGHGLVNTTNHNAYVFDWTTGEQVAEIQAPELYEANNFGQSVAVDDGKVLIGAGKASNLSVGPGESNSTDHTLEFVIEGGWDTVTLAPGEMNQTNDYLLYPHEAAGGRAFVFDLQTGELLQTLGSNEDLLAKEQFFGRNVVLHNGVAIVASPEDRWIQSGTLYAFDAETGVLLDTMTAAELDDLIPDYDNFSGFLGMALAMDGDDLFVVNEASYVSSGLPYGHVFTVPEPAGLVLVPLAAVLLCKRRRR